jgi:hypothetical protein
MEKNSDFCVGVRTLLKRMESNPEEFNVSGGNYGKWGRILEQVVLAKEAGSEKLPFPNHLSGLTAAEINAVYAGYSKFLRKRFDDYVMREILADAEELSYSLATAPNVVLGNSQGGSWSTTGFTSSTASYTLTMGKTSLSEELETIKRRVL